MKFDANDRPAWQRACALAVSTAMVWSLVPTAALAEAVAEVAPAADGAVTSVSEADAPVGQTVDVDASASDAGSVGQATVANSEGADEPAKKNLASSAVADAGADDGDADAAAAVPATASATVAIDRLSVTTADGADLNYYNSARPKVGDTVSVCGVTWDEDWEDEELSSSDYANLSYQWFSGDSRVTSSSKASDYASFSAIEGATSRELALGDAQADKYLACRVTDGAGNVTWSWGSTYQSVEPAADAGQGSGAGEDSDASRLAAAVAALKGVGFSGWYPQPAYGGDLNICDMAAAELESLGYGDVSVSLSSVEPGATDPAQVGGVDPATGEVTCFFLSPADKTGYSSYSLLTRFTPTFLLTLNGASVTYTSRSCSLPWDGALVSAYLTSAVRESSLPASVSSGEAACDVASESLPCELRVNGTKVGEVTWVSSDAAAAKVTTGYDYTTWTPTATVAYAHGATSVPVTLTARVTMSGASGLPSDVVEVEFPVTVAAKSAEQIAAQKSELSQALDAIVLKSYASTASGFWNKEDVDPSALTEDFLLPRASKTAGITVPSGAKLSYQVTAGDAVTLNGYHGVVTRGLGDEPSHATVTATLTCDGVTVTRDIQLVVPSVSDEEIDAAVAFMARVKAAYATALLGGNASVTDVTGDLSTFVEAVPNLSDPSGVSFVRSLSQSSDSGVIADSLPGYDPMAGTSWRTFRSDNTSVIEDETLRVTRPEADTYVSVSACLTYRRYESLAQAHPEDARLQSLVNQSVSAAFRVTGTVDHSDPTFLVSWRVVGTDDYGRTQAWGSGSLVATDSQSISDLTARMMGEAGLTADVAVADGTVSLAGVTDASGRTLLSTDGSGNCWQLIVSGENRGSAPADSALAPGVELVWYYGPSGAASADADAATVGVTAAVTGPGADGSSQPWVSLTELSVPQGATAAQVTRLLLQKNGMTCDDGMFTISAQSGLLPCGAQSLGSSQDASGTWSWWQFYVNGELSNELASDYVVKPGDRITWCYGAYGSEPPQTDVPCDPDAVRPSLPAAWPAFANGSNAVTEAPTPVEAAKLSWAAKTKDPNDWFTYTSDPIVVGGDVYVACGDTLVVLDAATGAAKRTACLATSVDSVSRLAYADGVVVVPLHGGRLQALTADTLTSVWVTDALPRQNGVDQQSLGTLTIADGHVYFCTDTGDRSAGYLGCVSLATGAVLWTRANDGAGYYWAGGTRVGSSLVLGDCAGTLASVDAATGETLATLDLGAPCRSTVVPAGNGVVCAVTTDGVLHKVLLESDGSMRELGSVSFAAYSTSTPTVEGGVAIVGGSLSDYHGVVAAIDLATMTVTSRVAATDDGTPLPAEVKSAPLVSRRDGVRHVYFTCNAEPGGVYLWREGEATAAMLFAPEGEQASYCMGSLVAGADGSLYYVNDSGYLFRLVSCAATRPEGGAEASTGASSGTSTDVTADKNVVSTASSGTGAASSSASISVPGNVSRTEETDAAEQAQAESLLAGVESDRVASAVAAAADEVARTMPVWPFVGMAVGACALLLLALAKRKNKGDE